MLLLALAAGTSGCSIKKIAVNKLGDSLASGGTTFASDDDPDLVGEALPFSLKLMESLLAESPQHRGLLLAASSGFTQYAFVYVQVPAEEAEGQDLAKADYLRTRARRLYLRARNYGLRDLEITHRGFESELRHDAKAAVRKAGSKDVPLLYWTAVSWGAAISVSKDDPEMISDQPIVEALIDRALELDPDYDSGAIHNFLITYESVRRTAGGDFAPRSRKHFERAVELTAGQSAGRPSTALMLVEKALKSHSSQHLPNGPYRMVFVYQSLHIHRAQANLLPLERFHRGWAGCAAFAVAADEQAAPAAPAAGSGFATPSISTRCSALMPPRFRPRSRLPRRMSSVCLSSTTHSISSPFSNSNASANCAGHINKTGGCPPPARSPWTFDAYPMESTSTPALTLVK